MQFGVAHSNELVPVPKVKKNEYNEVVFFVGGMFNVCGGSCTIGQVD